MRLRLNDQAVLCVEIMLDIASWVTQQIFAISMPAICHNRRTTTFYNFSTTFEAKRMAQEDTRRMKKISRIEYCAGFEPLQSGMEQDEGSRILSRPWRPFWIIYRQRDSETAGSASWKTAHGPLLPRGWCAPSWKRWRNSDCVKQMYRCAAHWTKPAKRRWTLWWRSSARSRRRVWLRLSTRCLKSKTSSLIYLDNNMALSDAEALKMDRRGCCTSFWMKVQNRP